MYILIKHINGEISSNLFIIWNEKELEEFKNGEYLIYNLDDYELKELNGITIGERKEHD